MSHTSPLSTEHDADFEADQRAFFFALGKAGIGYNMLATALEAAKLPRPSTGGRPMRQRILQGVAAGHDIKRLVQEERSYRSLYEGMEEYCEQEQRNLKGYVLEGRRPPARRSVPSPRLVLVTALEDIEHACRVAQHELGWSKAEVAQALRKAGASWSNGQITDCPVFNRPELMITLTTGESRRKVA